LASLVEVVHGIQGLALGTQSLIQGLFGSIIGLITPVFVFALGAFSPVLEVGSFSLSGTPGLLLCRRAVEEGRCCEPYCETEDAYCPVGPASPEMSSDRRRALRGGQAAARSNIAPAEVVSCSLIARFSVRALLARERRGRMWRW